MSRLGPLPKFRWTLSDGTPLNGGKVHTYVTATSTPKATYTDRTEGTQNDNPVTLDANGEADIWLLTDARYRYVIKDSAGVTLDTIDDVIPVPEPADFTGISNVVDDTTPQLGGNLDVNGKNIVTTSNADINLIPNGTGTVVVGTDLDVDNINIDGNTVSSTTGDLILSPAGGSNINFSGNLSLVNNNLTVSGTGAVTLFGVIYPTADGTANQIIETDGAGNLSFVTPAAGISQAVQADIEAETNEDTYIPPDLVKYSPGVAKGWVRYDQTNATVDASYNVTSVTDSTTGVIIVNWATDFSSANYSVVGTCDENGGSSSTVNIDDATAPTAGTTQLNIRDNSSVLYDSDIISVTAFGDQ